MTGSGGLSHASLGGDAEDGDIPQPRASGMSLLGGPEKDVGGSAHGIPCTPASLDADPRLAKGAEDSC
jgi:hypothetical protein